MNEISKEHLEAAKKLVNEHYSTLEALKDGHVTIMDYLNMIWVIFKVANSFVTPIDTEKFSNLVISLLRDVHHTYKKELEQFSDEVFRHACKVFIYYLLDTVSTKISENAKTESK